MKAEVFVSFLSIVPLFSIQDTKCNRDLGKLSFVGSVLGMIECLETAHEQKWPQMTTKPI